MKGKDLKPHIGIFGRRNNGKSSLLNIMTGQNVAIVSAQPGTTTDPVKKSLEVFGIGPAIIIDTAGIDDVEELGKLRIQKTLQVIPTVDMAILLISNNTFSEYEEKLIEEFTNYETPFVIVHNKSDIEPLSAKLNNSLQNKYKVKVIDFSVNNPVNLQDVINAVKEKMPETAYQKPSLFEGIIKPKDIVLLITPIDSEAPEGRMILPQVMAWRDVLDKDAICMSVKETELSDFLALGIKPALSITDSQVFKFVNDIMPNYYQLTSFSIVFARYRGNFNAFIEGTPHISKLKDGDRVLILESCTHQVSCDDIGRYKIPAWINSFSKKKLTYDIVAGFSEIPHPPQAYAIAIQCGGCVVTRKQLEGRLRPFVKAGVPVTNYGMAIAWVNGMFERVIQPFTKTNI